MEKNVEMQEVLIARNKDTGETGAVIGQNSDGSLKTAEVGSVSAGDLMKFSKEQNPVEAFVKNFITNAKNATLYDFFRVEADRFVYLGKAMSDLIGNADENKEMLEQYRVRVEKVEKPTESETLSEGKKAVEQEMPKAENVKPPRNTPVNPDSVDWDKIEKEWGVTREQLEKEGALSNMLYNHKSPGLVKIRPTLGGETYEMEARLSFKHNSDGSISLSPHFIRKEPQLDKEYKGYTFTPEDKNALRTTGNLGMAVELTDPKTGEKIKSLVSIDRLTNEIESVPVDKVYIKNKIANIDLSMRDIGILKSGGILKEQHIELQNGRKFTADLQYSADRRDVEFVNSQNYRQSQTNAQSANQSAGHFSQHQQNAGNWLDGEGNPKRLTKWCGIPLDAQKQADYMAGKKVYVGDTQDNKGNSCSLYMQFDPKEQRPKSTRIYPDREKVAGVAEANSPGYGQSASGHEKPGEANTNTDHLRNPGSLLNDDALRKERRKTNNQKM